MNRLRNALLVVSLVPTVTGCELARGCSAQFVYGISVEMRPGFAEPLPSDATFGFVRDGSYVDDLRVFVPTQLGDSLGPVPLVAAGERSGTFEVIVRRPGFVTWDTSGVRVRDDGCHPVTARLAVTLQPAP